MLTAMFRSAPRQAQKTVLPDIARALYERLATRPQIGIWKRLPDPDESVTRFLERWSVEPMESETKTARYAFFPATQDKESKVGVIPHALPTYNNCRALRSSQ